MYTYHLSTFASVLGHIIFYPALFYIQELYASLPISPKFYHIYLHSGFLLHVSIATAIFREVIK